MITIIKEGNKIKCSNGTYETMYKRLGYKILNENKPQVKETEGLEDTSKEKIVMPKETSKVKSTRSKSKKGE